MRIFLLLLLSVVYTASAQTTQKGPKINPEKKRFVYQSGSQITKRTYDSIYFDLSYDKGNKLVFMYTFSAKESEGVADDEYFESIIFEITPPKGASFSIKTAQFEKAKVVYNRGCFCADAGLRQLYEGAITGKKIAPDTWHVSYDLMIEPRPGRSGLAVNKKLKGTFKPGKLIQ